jgi:hypothetical protein
LSIEVFAFSFFLLLEIRIGSHEHEQRQALTAGVFHSVLLACGSEDDLVYTEFLRLASDEENPATIEHVINFIFQLMCVDFLFLAGFKAIDVAKEISGLKEIYLLHLIGRK